MPHLGKQLVVSLTGMLLAATVSGAAERDLIGYTALAARPGALQADGAGIPVAQVEVFPTGTTAYAPDTSNAVFAGKTFTFRSGSSAASPHANGVASLFYGDAASAAPGVSSVSLFSADSFLNDWLHVGSSTRAPGAVAAPVVNNSWIASFSNNASNADVLHRLDDLINRDDVLIFNAVDNVATHPFPKLLASSFNGVSVGTLTGSHGPFTFDAAGPRIKPDLVVGVDTTSSASALAAGAGALLRSEAKARNLPAGEMAIKAILMAGAHRDASWRRGRPSGKDNTTAPLDFQQGAGQLRVDHSFDILTAGRQSAGTSIAPAGGWDYARTPRGTTGEMTYYLHAGQTLPQWAAVLTWNRAIAGLDGGRYSTAPRTPDLDLSIYLSKRGGRRLIARSDSPYDNVETLTLADLPAGDYQVVLTTDVRSYYSLAWYADPVPASSATPSFVPMSQSGVAMSDFSASAVPEPTALVLMIPAAILLRRRRRA